MKKFRYFLLVLAGVTAVMLGGCKDKEKYDESAFQDDLEPLSEWRPWTRMVTMRWQ